MSDLILNFRIIYWHIQIGQYFSSFRIEYNDYHKENNLKFGLFQLYEFKISLIDILFIIPFVGILTAMKIKDCRNLEYPVFNIYHILSSIIIVFLSLSFYYR